MTCLFAFWGFLFNLDIDLLLFCLASAICSLHADENLQDRKAMIFEAFVVLIQPARVNSGYACMSALPR